MAKARSAENVEMVAGAADTMPAAVAAVDDLADLDDDHDWRTRRLAQAKTTIADPAAHLRKTLADNRDAAAISLASARAGVRLAQAELKAADALLAALPASADPMPAALAGAHRATGKRHAE